MRIKGLSYSTIFGILLIRGYTIMTYDELWELYERDKKILNYSPVTLKSYKLQCRILKDYLDNPDVEAVTREQIKEYLAEQTHLKPQSLGHRIRFINSFHRWAIDEGYLNKNPATGIKEPRMGERVPKFLTEEDIETLRESCSDRRERALFEFLFTTGCRIGEVARANRNDLNWTNGSIVVFGKDKKHREVYFTSTCKIWLKKYLEDRTDDCPALFTTIRKPIRRASIDQLRFILKKIAKRAGIDANVYPHRLRHSFATHLLNKGAPMEVIQHTLGHKKYETTQIYANLSTEKRREMYFKYF